MEQRNLILAIVISVTILLGFELLYNIPRQQAELARQQAQQEQTAGEEAPTPDGPEAQAPGEGEAALGTAATAPDRTAVLDQQPRVRIDTPKLSGSIALVGGRLDDVTLTRYRHSLEPDSERIHLLSPPQSRQSYYASFGWSGPRGVALDLPAAQTRWQANGEVLAPGQDVTLTWTNPGGLTFERTFSIDRDYMITVTQRVRNDTGEAVSLAPYGLISRRGTPETSGFYILHEGPLGVLQGTLEEHSYGTLRDDGVIAQATTGGWIGITDKYWLVSLVPDQDREVEARFTHSNRTGVEKYQTDILYDTVTIAPGESATQTSRVFAGAKEVAVLDRYKDELGVPMFDKAVDFGWLYFMNKPLFQLLKFFADFTGNFGVAILILVVLIKIVFYPLANKSYRSMAKMRNLQPEMQRLREQFGDDKQRMNQEIMALYKREGANPASGCLPILIQIPVFFALYKVLLVTIEMRHAPFFGWIQDLSAKDPTAITNLFGLMPWGVPELGPLEVINIGILPIIMGVTMYAQQMLNPQPADPMQAKIFKFLPVVFTFLLAQFPAGLVLYWTSNNVLTGLQQYIIMKRAGAQIGGKMTPLGKSAGGTGNTDKGKANAGDPSNGDAAANARTGADTEAEAAEPQTAAGEPAAEAADAPAGATATPAAKARPAPRRSNPAAKSHKGRKGRKR